MFRTLIFLSLILTCETCNAQFSGLTSFFADTTLRAMMKNKRVVSVTEFVKEDSGTFFNGRYFFNTNGFANDLVTGRGPYYTHMKFEYNKMGMVTKQVHYDNLDTGRVEYWSTRTFDTKNRITKYERGRMQDGKPLMTKEFEVTYLSDKKGAIRMENKQYSDNKLRSITLYRDSISRKDTFMVSYEYQMDERTGKRVATRKSLGRSYQKEGVLYSDEITYAVYGKTETAQKIKTHYQLLNEKGIWTGYGELSYDEAYEAFMQEHPDDFNPNYYSPVFIKAILEGKVKGVRKPEDEYSFNEKGQLVQTDSQGFRYTFKYNDQNQLIEQIIFKEQERVGILLIFYNDKGLISKTLNTYTDPESEGSSNKKIQEYSYTYTYY